MLPLGPPGRLNICYCFSSQQPREKRSTSEFRKHRLHARCFHRTQTPGDCRAGRKRRVREERRRKHRSRSCVHICASKQQQSVLEQNTVNLYGKSLIWASFKTTKLTKTTRLTGQFKVQLAADMLWIFEYFQGLTSRPPPWRLVCLQG